MRIEMAAFTARGMELGERLEQGLRLAGDAVRLQRPGALREWVDEVFGEADTLIFIGAVGIAVRGVAPKLVSKTSDPAVVVVDDCGRFAVSLLSGHIGGANELALRVAKLIDAVPVVTTATDGNGVFAVDVWAREKGLVILNPEAIKTVSAKLLDGEGVRLRAGFPLRGELPKGVGMGDGPADIVVDVIHTGSNENALRLVPPVAVLGVGCRRGTEVETIAGAFTEFCRCSDIAPQAFCAVCSIDLKKDEAGLVEFCRQAGLPFRTFSVGALNEVPGDFTASEFVRDVTGVDNVCERSAALGSGGGRVIVRKTVLRGVTFAAAVKEFVLTF